MLLHFLGEKIEEATLRSLFGTTTKGTAAINILMLNASLPEMKVELHHSSLADLQRYLETKLHPCIVGLRTSTLPHWKGRDCLHAVVVHGFDDVHIFLNDPYFDEAEFPVTIAAFMRAWSAVGNIAITMERKASE
jgi:ABC-type bacteriocin/lantibiotic exporter with double-glycine peptidase domain